MIIETPQIPPRLRETLARLGHDPDHEITLAGKAGSGRLYLRLGIIPHSHVLLISPPEDADFERFIAISRHLRAQGLAVPEIVDEDAQARMVLLEDLGAQLLWNRVQDDAPTPAGEDHLVALYQPVLEALAEWQDRGTAAMPSCKWLNDRVFDYEALRWETNYFATRYLAETCSLPRETWEAPEIVAEFDALARRVEAHGQVLMHRDFQSQNLMWHHGRIWFIDYQGARRGSRWYDLASVLWDPYIALPSAARERLFARFLELRPYEGTREAAWREFLDASLQRLMQAMGAYSFLSRHKGLAWFAAYLGPGRALLDEAIAQRTVGGELPALRALLDQAR